MTTTLNHENQSPIISPYTNDEPAMQADSSTTAEGPPFPEPVIAMSENARQWIRSALGPFLKNSGPRLPLPLPTLEGRWASPPPLVNQVSCGGAACGLEGESSDEDLSVASMEGWPGDRRFPLADVHPVPNGFGPYPGTAVCETCGSLPPWAAVSPAGVPQDWAVWIPDAKTGRVTPCPLYCEDGVVYAFVCTGHGNHCWAPILCATAGQAGWEAALQASANRRAHAANGNRGPKVRRFGPLTEAQTAAQAARRAAAAAQQAAAAAQRANRTGRTAAQRPAGPRRANRAPRTTQRPMGPRTRAEDDAVIGIERIIRRLTSSCGTPPGSGRFGNVRSQATGPTNAEMHAYNGNIPDGGRQAWADTPWTEEELWDSEEVTPTTPPDRSPDGHLTHVSSPSFVGPRDSLTGAQRSRLAAAKGQGSKARKAAARKAAKSSLGGRLTKAYAGKPAPLDLRPQPTKDQPALEGPAGQPVEAGVELKNTYAALLLQDKIDELELTVSEDDADPGPKEFRVVKTASRRVADSREVRRLLPVLWKTYTAPQAGCLGIIDDEGIKTGLSPDVKAVSLPAGLVHELGAWLAHRSRDDPKKTFAALVMKTKNLCKQFAVTPSQLHDCVVYGPVIAWLTTESLHKAAEQAVYYRKNRYLSAAGAMLCYAGLASLPTASAGATIASTVVGGPVGSAAFWVAGAALSWAAASKWALWASSSGLRVAELAGTAVRIGSQDSTKPAPPQALGSKVVRIRDADKPKTPEDTATTVVGLAVKGFLPHVQSLTEANEELAIKSRVTHERLEYDEAFFEEYRGHVLGNLPTYVGQLKRLRAQPFEDWVAKFEPGKRERYRLVKAGLDAEGIDEDSLITPDKLREWTTRKAFGKLEHTLTSNVHGVSPKAGRAIQAASDEMTVLTGPWIAAFYAYMAERWDGTGRLAWSSHLNREVVASHVRAGDDNFLPDEDDFSDYDGSFHSGFVKLENEVYARYGAPASVRQLYGPVGRGQRAYNTRGVTANGLRYEGPCMRRSGDNNTSGGNTFVTGTTHDFIFCKEKEVSVEESSLRLVACGDDNLASYPGPRVDWASNMLRLGLKAKPQYRTDWHEAEFCSEVCTEAEDGQWTFTMPAGRAISKISCSLRADPKKLGTHASFARSSALSLRASNRANPLTSAYIERVLECSRGTSAAPERRYTFREGAGLNPSDSGTMALLERYQWTYNDFQMYLDELASANALGVIHDWPMAALLCERDSDGPKDVYAEMGAGPSSPAAHASRTADQEELKDGVVYEEVSKPQVLVAWRGGTHVVPASHVRDIFSHFGVSTDACRASKASKPLDPGDSLADGDHVELTARGLGGSGRSSGANTRVARGEQLMDALANAVGMSKPGEAWVIMAIDPWHDRAVEATGFIDLASSFSVRQRYAASAVIAAPPGLTTGTFDVWVIACPWKFTTTMTNGVVGTNFESFSIPANGVSYATSVTGGYVVIAGPSGFTPTLAPQAAVTNVTYAAYGLPTSVRQTSNRVISSAFEATNTTAAIYRQGTATLWRMAQPEYDTGASIIAGIFTAGTTGPFISVGWPSVTWMDDMPPSIAQAMIQPGSVQWSAEEGAYMPSAFNSMILPENAAANYQPGITTGGNAPGAIPISSTSILLGATSAALTGLSWPQQEWAKHQMGGVAFTGLSLQTTFNLAMIDYVEEFPVYKDSTFVTLAQPSPAYDPAAMAVYSAILRLLPVGARARDNGLGEWFLGAVGAIARNLGPLLGLAPHPALKLAGIGATALGNYIASRGSGGARGTGPPMRRSTNLARGYGLLAQPD